MAHSDKASDHATLVLLTEQYNYAGLVRAGKIIAGKTNAGLYLISLLSNKQRGKRLHRDIERLFIISRELNAEMLVFYTDEPVKVLLNCIRRFNAKDLIGIPGTVFQDVINRIRAASLDICVHVLNNNGELEA